MNKIQKTLANWIYLFFDFDLIVSVHHCIWIQDLVMTPQTCKRLLYIMPNYHCKYQGHYYYHYTHYVKNNFIVSCVRGNAFSVRVKADNNPSLYFT